MGEWLKPADCKSAPPCEVRRFESFPVHQIFARDRQVEFGKKISSSAGSIRGFGGIGIRNLARPESARRDAGDPGHVCGEDVGAAKRCDAPGWRESE